VADGIYGWGDEQWSYWNDLGNRESGWRWDAVNASSGAYGIPQSLPPEKLAAAGADWRTNAGTQIDWMANYILNRYSTPAGAITFHDQNNWYDDGGMMQPGTGRYTNDTKRPEPVLTGPQWDAIFTLAAAATPHVRQLPRTMHRLTSTQAMQAAETEQLALLRSIDRRLGGEQRVKITNPDAVAGAVSGVTGEDRRYDARMGRMGVRS
jgi:hypothetical protein